MSHTLTRKAALVPLRASALLAAAIVFTMISSDAEAKRIERACLGSSRSAASPSLCNCIQRVADQTLSGSDQRLAAKFFDDPQMAQDIRQSDRRNHEEFWKRYKTFGYSAQKVCR